MNGDRANTHATAEGSDEKQRDLKMDISAVCGLADSVKALYQQLRVYWRARDI